MRDPNLATYYCFVGDRKLGGEGLGPATALPCWPPTGTKYYYYYRIRMATRGTNYG